MNLRPLQLGKTSFAVSLLVPVTLVFSQYISQVRLILLFLIWLDEVPFPYKWLPILLTVFFTALLYEKRDFTRILQISGFIGIGVTVILLLLLSLTGI